MVTTASYVLQVWFSMARKGAVPDAWLQEWKYVVAYTHIESEDISGMLAS